MRYFEGSLYKLVIYCRFYKNINGMTALGNMQKQFKIQVACSGQAQTICNQNNMVD